MLEQELKDFVDSLAVDYKYIIGQIGNLTTLPSDVAKTSVAAALISLNNKIAGAAGIDDAVQAANKTWSSNKIHAQIDAAVAQLVNGAPAALDTLKELADQMTADKNVLDTIATALGKRVRVDAAQSFSSVEQAQARTNIGAYGATEIGNPQFDYAAYYAQQKATA